MKIKKVKRKFILYKTGKEIITFGNIENGKHKFHRHKHPISIYYVNINRIVASNKVHFVKKGFKNFIGYQDRRHLGGRGDHGLPTFLRR